MNLLTDSTLPIRIFPAQRKDYRKIICLYHGWGSSVTKYEEFARMLSEQGFTVIVPELHLHDSRDALATYFTRASSNVTFGKSCFKASRNRAHSFSG
ncbi:hypothetical protein [Exiguobacterium sp. S22-S28]|uniref:hypothetical protein n=1 Tax=Exiguobacterium sp. S22-S28 TaxID=3342768 RepID=UPI00372D56DB